MTEDAIPSTRAEDVRLILGSAKSGKTRALVSRAQALLEAGEDARDILFVAAAPACVDALEETVPEGVRVCIAATLAAGILASAGGRCRLLDECEEQFLFEDLRTTGLPQKPLRRILAFIEASQAGLSDWDEDWIEMREERLVFDTLSDILAFTGGVTRPEAAGLALRALAADADMLDTAGVDHVIVDNYGLLSRSEQTLCAALARKSIAVAGEEGRLVPSVNPYACPEGLASFIEEFPHARTDVLGQPQSAVDEERLAAKTVEEELSLIAGTVGEALEQGCAPERIAVVGANGAWRRNAARALKAAGIGVTRPAGAPRVKDFADTDACKAVCADALRKLKADPRDGVALRTLYGVGDHLARSAQLKRLRDEHPGRTLAELYADGIVDIDVPEPPRDTSPAEGGVMVCAPADLFGRTFELVVFGGLVKGWVPARAYFDAVGARKDALLDDALRSVDLARHAAHSRLLTTSFSQCSLEFAERLGIHYRRIRLIDGVRTCEVAPFEEW